MGESVWRTGEVTANDRKSSADQRSSCLLFNSPFSCRAPTSDPSGPLQSSYFSVVTVGPSSLENENLIHDEFTEDKKEHQRILETEEKISSRSL